MKFLTSGAVSAISPLQLRVWDARTRRKHGRWYGVPFHKKRQRRLGISPMEGATKG